MAQVRTLTLSGSHSTTRQTHFIRWFSRTLSFSRTNQPQHRESVAFPAEYWPSAEPLPYQLFKYRFIQLFTGGIARKISRNVEWFLVWASSKIWATCSFISWSGDSKMATVFIPSIRNRYATKGIESIWNAWRDFEKGIWEIGKWADFGRNLQKRFEIWPHFCICYSKTVLPRSIQVWNSW